MFCLVQAAVAERSYQFAVDRPDGAKVKRRPQGGHEGDVPVLPACEAAKLRASARGFVVERMAGVRGKYGAERQRAFLPHCT